MADKGEPRVYGMADPPNRDLPAAEGMRGEKASTRPRERDPDFSHPVTLGDGNTVTISEGSGVAYAEATSRVAHAEPRPRPGKGAEDEPLWRVRPWPLVAGLLAGLGIIGLTAWQLRSGSRGNSSRWARLSEQGR